MAARHVSRRKTPGMLAARVSCDPRAIPLHDPVTVTEEHMVFSYEATPLLLDTGAKHKTLVFIMMQLRLMAVSLTPPTSDL